MNVSGKINPECEETKDLASFYKAQQYNIASVLQTFGKKWKFVKRQGHSVSLTLLSNTGQHVYHPKQLLT